jgi:hypothetical protein
MMDGLIISGENNFIFSFCGLYMDGWQSHFEAECTLEKVVRKTKCKKNECVNPLTTKLR